MTWMMIGAAMIVGGGSVGAPRPADSAAWAQLRSQLPEELRAKVERARQNRRIHQDTISRLSPAERSQWLDSLRREAVTRRSDVLQSLSPNERLRMEERFKEMQDQMQQRGPLPRNPHPDRKEMDPPR